MDPLHARYPFLQSAREAVETTDTTMDTIVAEEDPIVERAMERIQHTIEDGTIGDQVADSRVELLSYPVARILVSLIDERVLNHRYPHAEAATAYQRFVSEFEENSTDELRSVSTNRLTLHDLLKEFNLEDHVREFSDGFKIDVSPYLSLSASINGDDWRLVNRTVNNGMVEITQIELYRILQQAIQQRIQEGLPFSVPESIADHLTEQITQIEEMLADLDLTREIDTVVPELFPPCMKHLLDQIQSGEHLEHHSRFAITAFLTTIGLSTDEIVDIYQVNPGFGEEMTRYQTNHIRGETSPTQYTPPSCATMKSYGDCVNMDALCEEISHPLSYYEVKLDDADEEELQDWRGESE
ncbi:MAG: DNA primase regulatory subunit PriL [Halobacteriaceae archaeon]